MTFRKKKIIIIQIFLLTFGLLAILFTYVNFDKGNTNKILTDIKKKEIDKKFKDNTESQSVFYNMEYSGLDLSGNKYILKAKEAINDDNIDNKVKLKFVEAIFYFKNNERLYISSNFGVYDNKTFDMIFEKNVEGKYGESTLSAEKAEYLNSKNFLTITKDVKINDTRGTMIAEKLMFDIEKNTLDISSSGNKKINANLNYK